MDGEPHHQEQGDGKHGLGEEQIGSGRMLGKMRIQLCTDK